MYKRENYINKIKSYIDKPLIKIITGMRRSGKSYFLNSLMEELRLREEHNLIYINKESLEFEFIGSYQELYSYVKEHIQEGRKNYLFIDEVQEIIEWEKAVTSFYADQLADIYITGSNAHLLSSELATLLSGRYVEFPIYSLGFNEFIQFHHARELNRNDFFKLFIRYGGFPALYHLDLEDEIVYQYINSLFNTILLKDIVKKNNIRNIGLLENIIRFVFDNIGNIFSAKKVSDYLNSQKIRINMETVQNYLSYLASTFSIYKVNRYDIKRKRLLEIHEKYYVGDIGLRQALLGFKEADISGILENIVFLELKQRGYKVYIGKLDDNEIDFIAEKQNEKKYIQVAYLLSSPETIEREFSVLKKIPDNYPKIVVSMDTLFGSDFEGIKRVNIIDFLLNNNW